VRGALKRAIELERQAISVVTAITADDVGQFADQNVAESLQRVPGVFIDRDEGEGRSVRIRGLSNDFNQVTINGAQIGSSDASGGRSVALDVISSELLSGIQIAKALTADQDHDSLGALVDLTTLSAFDRPGNSLRLRAEGSYNQRADAGSPKFAVDGTARLAGDTIGIAFAVNYFDRKLQGDNLRNDAGPPFQRVYRSPAGTLSFSPSPGAELFLRPQEADQRVEIGQRERIGATFGFEFRPDDDNRFELNVISARLRDEDVRVQQELEFRRSDTPARIRSIGPREGELVRADVEKQISFQDRTDKVFALNVEGENRLTDRLALTYAADYSHNRFSLPGGLRGRFRERLVPLSYSATRDTLDFVFGTPPAGVDPLDPARYDYDNILLYDEYRTDEILSYGLDLRYDIDLFGPSSVLLFGVKNRQRDKVIRRGEISRDFENDAQRAPLVGQVPLTLAGLELFTPQRTKLANLGFFPALDAARNQFSRTVDILGLTTVNAGRVDYDSSEDVLAGYAMLSLQPSETFSVVAGLRVERTRSRGIGTVITRIERDGSQISNNSVAGASSGIDYTSWLPSVHLRWEPTPEIVARLILSRQQARPAFDDIRANQEIEVEQVTEAGVVRTVSRILEGGNPRLKPLIANAVDATLGWYPSRNFSLTAAAFYKDLRDPFVSATYSGADVALTGNPVFDPVTGEGFTEVDAAGNAGSGRLVGVELGLNYFARTLPKPFDGLFASGNLTLIDGQIRSEFIRDNAKLPLNNQPSTIANLSLGYEDDRLTLRWSGNYVSRSLLGINTADPFLDRFNKSFFSMDVNARVNITDWLQVYADAININEAQDTRFYRGNGSGGFYERVDDFGRTFQIGVTGRFAF
jgi:TonB-dependent receptor